MKMRSVCVLLTGVFCLLTMVGCGSSDDVAQGILKGIPTAGASDTDLDLSKYDEVQPDIELMQMPAATFLYFDKSLTVKGDAAHDGFGVGIFVYQGEHIDNNKAMDTQAACLIVRSTDILASIGQGQTYGISDVVKSSSAQNSNVSFDGTEISLVSSLYKGILLKGTKVKDLVDVCFAGKVKLLTPKK